MRYTTVPKEVSFKELWLKGTLSPSLYERVTCTNPNIKKVADLIEPPIKGKEVGSTAYVEKSNYYFIRTRALQEIGYLLQADSESIVPIKPKAFIRYDLAKSDILYSKDSNIGECCIIESDTYKDYMISSGILKLVAKEDPFYLFAFLKHPFVKLQLRSMTSKGSTIRHSGLKFLSCVIPFPRGSNADEIIEYVKSLVQIDINVETTIREKDKAIHQIISQELISRQKSNVYFNYEPPRIKDIEQVGRLDAGIYSRPYKEKMFLITNYTNGFEPVTSQTLDFSITPGPSLELKLLKTRIDSDEPKDGFYTLIIPTNISDYGTLERLQYMGTAKRIDGLRFGDIIIGESGTWRSMVLLSDYPRCITNAHGSCLHHRKGDLDLSIFIRCILAWYKRIGLFDFMVVGGSGGHLSPSYFDRILIPNFPEDVRKKIVELYYEESGGSGIAQLNEQRLTILKQLDLVLDSIINDKPITMLPIFNLKSSLQ